MARIGKWLPPEETAPSIKFHPDTVAQRRTLVIGLLGGRRGSGFIQRGNDRLWLDNGLIIRTYFSDAVCMLEEYLDGEA